MQKHILTYVYVNRYMKSSLIYRNQQIHFHENVPRELQNINGKTHLRQVVCKAISESLVNGKAYLRRVF